MEDDRFFKSRPDFRKSVRHEIRYRAAGGEAQPDFAGVGAVDSKGRELGVRLKIVIQRLMPAATLATTAEITDGDGGLSINGWSDGAGISIRFGVDPMDVLKNGIGSAALCAAACYCLHGAA